MIELAWYQLVMLSVLLFMGGFVTASFIQYYKTLGPKDGGGP